MSAFAVRYHAKQICWHRKEVAQFVHLALGRFLMARLGSENHQVQSFDFGEMLAISTGEGKTVLHRGRRNNGIARAQSGRQRMLLDVD